MERGTPSPHPSHPPSLHPKVLVVGYGNPLRSDDGAGLRAAEILDRKALPGAEVRAVQQLQVEMASDLRAFDQIVLIDASDASAGGPEVDLRKVEPVCDGGPASTHHLSPERLSALCVRLYGITPALRVCTIRGENFDMGDQLTPIVQRRVDVAVRKIESFMRQSALSTRQSGNTKQFFLSADD
jgi:hydrogenase maturation protease